MSSETDLSKRLRELADALESLPLLDGRLAEAAHTLDALGHWADSERASVPVDKAPMYRAGFFDAQAEVGELLSRWAQLRS